VKGRDSACAGPPIGPKAKRYAVLSAQPILFLRNV
jgi:hypothetical protein